MSTPSASERTESPRSVSEDGVGRREGGSREGGGREKGGRMRTGDASLNRIPNQRIAAATADVSIEPHMWRRDGKRLFFSVSSMIKSCNKKAQFLLIISTIRKCVALMATPNKRKNKYI